jgi:isopropylmalate/homocitrate/citramalate synthase
MIELVEVGPRDGLQNVPVVVAPAVRGELCRRLHSVGLTRVEAVSFVSAQRVPQMAGAEEVLAAARGSEPALTSGGDLEALVLNGRGLDRAIAARVRRIRYAVSVSDAFNRRNAGVDAATGLGEATTTVARAALSGIGASAVVATAFGCPFSGEVPLRDVVESAERLAEAGADEVIFADTIGVAVPRQIRAVLDAVRSLPVRLGVHLHDTRGTAQACAFAAIESGATVLDSSIGGLGGCPFAPGATGNVATEDLAWMLAREGVPMIAIDLDALLDAGRWLAEVSGVAPASHLARAGVFPPVTAVAA